MRICNGLMVLLFIAGTSIAQTTRSAKKLIEFGWDEPDTAFMRRHIARMEQTPFDGVVFHVLSDPTNGKPGNFMNEGWGSARLC